MPLSTHDADNTPDPYDPSFLPPEYKALLDKICEGVGTKPISSEPENWDGAVFLDFVMNDVNVDLTQEFKAYLKNNDIKYPTLQQVKTEGLGWRSAKKAFRLSAKYQERPLKDFIYDYILYCKSRGRRPAAFDHEKCRDLVDNILRAAGVPIESPLSLQDEVVLNGEIEALKKLVRFYPYGKDQAEKFDPHTLEKANRRAETLLGISPENTDLLCIKAFILGNSGHIEKAGALIADLMDIDDQNIHVLDLYTASLTRYQKKYEEALVHAQKASELYPDNAKLTCNLAICYCNLGDTEKASSTFNRAIAQDKKLLSSYIDFADYLWKIGFISKAEEILARGLKAIPDNTYLQQAVIKIASQGKLRMRLEDAAKLMGKDGLDSDLAIFANVSEDPDTNSVEAIETALAGLTEKSNDPILSELERNIWQAISGICFLTLFVNHKTKDKYGQYALENFEGVISKLPGYLDYEVREYRALTCFLLGNFSDSKSLFEELIDAWRVALDEPYHPRVYLNTREAIADQGFNNPMLPLYWFAEKSPTVEVCSALVADLISKEKYDEAVPYFETGYELVGRREGDISTGSEILALSGLQFYMHYSDIKFLKQTVGICQENLTDAVKNEDFDLFTQLLSLILKAVNFLGVACEDVSILNQVFKALENIDEKEIFAKSLNTWTDIKYQVFCTYCHLLMLESKEEHVINALKAADEIIEYADFESSFFGLSVNGIFELDRLFTEGSKSFEYLQAFLQSMARALKRIDETSHPELWATVTLESGYCFFRLGKLDGSENYFMIAKMFLKKFLQLPNTDISAKRGAEVSEMIEFCESNISS